MQMSLTEIILDIPSEHMKNVFGQFDDYMKKIEKSFQVTIVSREGNLKIIGTEPAALKA